MATPYFIRSFRALLLAVLVVGGLTTSVKSGGSDPEIDPRDQYVGTYTGTYRNIIYVVEDGDPPRAGTATTTITKGSNSKEIYIEILTAGDRTGDKKLNVTAELDGVNFTVIDKNTDTIPITNPVSGEYTASGVFDPNTRQVSYTSVARALRNGAQYRQTYEITGTKQ